MQEIHMLTQSQFLSPEEQQTIHEESLKILREVGALFHSNRALKILEQSGAIVDKKRELRENETYQRDYKLY